MENEENFHPFNYRFGVVTIFGLKFSQPLISDIKQQSYSYFNIYENSRILDDRVIEDSSFVISLTDTSIYQSLKYLGRVLNEIKESKTYPNRKYLWEEVNVINHVYRPVILVGLSSTATKQIPFEQIDRMAFNFNGSLYIEMGTNIVQDADKILLFGLLLMYIQKVYQIQFR